MNTHNTSSSTGLPRRTFLKTSSGLALGVALGSSGVLSAAERRRAIGANDRIRNGRTPHAPIEAGYQHAVAALMAVLSHETGKRMIYDPEKREIRAG